MPRPLYYGPMEPVHECRVMVTRHCPAIYEGPCGDDRPCARYESEDETPWLPELAYDDVILIDRPPGLAAPQVPLGLAAELLARRDRQRTTEA